MRGVRLAPRTAKGSYLEISLKILIGYDGLIPSNAAIDDLPRAGLPREAEAVVMSVAELPPPSFYEMTPAPVVESLPGGVDGARVLASRASERVQALFPQWKVRSEARVGSPARELVREADVWKADLIVVGSHGRSGLERVFLGSVSQAIVTNARSAVRVARGGSPSAGPSNPK